MTSREGEVSNESELASVSELTSVNGYLMWLAVLSKTGNTYLWISISWPTRHDTALEVTFPWVNNIVTTHRWQDAAQKGIPLTLMVGVVDPGVEWQPAVNSMWIINYALMRAARASVLLTSVRSAALTALRGTELMLLLMLILIRWYQHQHQHHQLTQ